jgi:hypothetical protein
VEKKIWNYYFEKQSRSYERFKLFRFEAILLAGHRSYFVSALEKLRRGMLILAFDLAS